jgi:hypothetical protein
MGRFALLVGVIAAGGGAYLGYVDQEVLGAVVGGIVGLVVGSLLGSLLDFTVGPFLRHRAEHSFGAWFLRILGLVLTVVFLHEAFWASNIGSLALMHNIGARITQMFAKGTSKEKAQKELKDRRWQPQVFSARPQRLIMIEDVREDADKTLKMVDGVLYEDVAIDRDLSDQATEIADHTEKRLDVYVSRTLLLRFIPRNVLLPKE